MTVTLMGALSSLISHVKESNHLARVNIALNHSKKPELLKSLEEEVEFVEEDLHMARRTPLDQGQLEARIDNFVKKGESIKLVNLNLEGCDLYKILEDRKLLGTDIVNKGSIENCVFDFDMQMITQDQLIRRYMDAVENERTLDFSHVDFRLCNIENITKDIWKIPPAPGITRFNAEGRLFLERHNIEATLSYDSFFGTSDRELNEIREGVEEGMVGDKSKRKAFDPFIGANFQNTDLSGQNLSILSLRKANLQNTNLSNAKGLYCPYADLRNADLSNASIAKHKLGALVGADLSGADLNGIRLPSLAVLTKDRIGHFGNGMTRQEVIDHRDQDGSRNTAEYIDEDNTRDLSISKQIWRDYGKETKTKDATTFSSETKFKPGQKYCGEDMRSYFENNLVKL